jgi:hypothetical protein
MGSERDLPAVWIVCVIEIVVGNLVRNPHLVYDANDVYFVPDVGTITVTPGFAGNQGNVARGINNAILGGTNPKQFVRHLAWLERRAAHQRARSSMLR